MRPSLLTLALILVLAACGGRSPKAPGPSGATPGEPTPSDRAPSEPAPADPAPSGAPSREPEPSPAVPAISARGEELAAHARVGAVVSAAGRAVLAAPDSVTMHSIKPEDWRAYGYGRNTDPSPLAHALSALEAKKGVLGTLVLDQPSDQAAILEAFYEGLVEEGPLAACYDPRHALIYKKNEVTVAVFICFKCHYAVVLEAATEKGRYTPLQDPAGLKPRLNGMLEAAGIPLAP